MVLPNALNSVLSSIANQGESTDDILRDLRTVVGDLDAAIDKVGSAMNAEQRHTAKQQRLQGIRRLIGTLSALELAWSRDR